MALNIPIHVRARIRAYAEAGVDVCVINPLTEPDTVDDVIRALAPSLDGLDLRTPGIMRATAS